MAEATETLSDSMLPTIEWKQYRRKCEEFRAKRPHLRLPLPTLPAL